MEVVRIVGRRGAAWVVAVVCLLAIAPSASAEPQIPAVTSLSGPVTSASSASFVWEAAVPDPGGVVVDYEGGLVADPAATPTGDLDGTTRRADVTLPPTDGTFYFKVRAIELVLDGPPVAGPYASASLIVDRTPPSQPAPAGPADGAALAGEPAYSWSPVDDSPAGVDRYEVWASYDPGVPARPVARVAASVTSARRDPALAPAPPEGATVSWLVLAVDRAGNVSPVRPELTRHFRVDTTAPAAPVITRRPPSPTGDDTPAFSWRGEAGARFTWQVSRLGGGRAQGPVTTSATSASVGPLAPGTYAFRLTQTDAAGNTSPAASAGFTVPPGVGRPPAPESPPSIGPTGLPAVRSGRLAPRAGALLASRTPTLRWSRGPRGTTVYNVQIFRVVEASPQSPRVLVKVVSAFPRRTEFTPAAPRIRPGACYAWRVWPFVGSRAARQPIGVSNFCVRASAQAGGQVTLSRAQLLINQRISQAAVRRVGAAIDRLAAGLDGADFRPGSIGLSEFHPALLEAIAAGAPPAAPGPVAPPRPVPARRYGPSRPGRVTLSRAQLLINQRISQAAVLRVNALAERLDGNLTAGDIRAGTLGAAALDASARQALAGPLPAGPAVSTAFVPLDVAAPKAGRPGRVRLSSTQLLINQRISQAAVRRVNAILAQLSGGLTGANVRDGSLGRATLAPAVQAAR